MTTNDATCLLHLSIYQSADGSLSVYYRGEVVGEDYRATVYRPPLDEQALRRLEHAVGDSLATALLTAQERHPF